MKFLFFALVSIFVFNTPSFGGESGAHGADPMKDRFIMAKDGAITILKSPKSQAFFTKGQLKLMVEKLQTPDPNAPTTLCFEQKLCWYNTDPTNPQPPLRAELNGRPIEAVLSTTTEISSAIQIDIYRAKLLGIDSKLAVVMLIHEAGHAVGLSDDLTTDSRIIKLLEQYPELLNSISKINDPSSSQGKSEGVRKITCLAKCQLAYDIKGNSSGSATYDAYGEGNDYNEAIKYLYLDCENAAKRAAVAWKSKRWVTHNLISHQNNGTTGTTGFWSSPGSYADQRFDVHEACAESGR